MVAVALEGLEEGIRKIDAAPTTIMAMVPTIITSSTVDTAERFFMSNVPLSLGVVS